jgi:NADPH2:quinone reductase
MRTFPNGEMPKLALNLMLLKGASIVGVFWDQHIQREPKLARTVMQQSFGWIKEGRLRPPITKCYPLERTADVLSDMANRRVSGKIVIEL